jgi:Mg2+/citrate symporter
MLPDEVYKRRHYGTPQSILLIVSNFTVFAVLASIFADGKTVNWFFWVGMGLLAIYNILNIRKDREEYNRARIIAYVISVLLMAGMFLMFRAKV